MDRLTRFWLLLILVMLPGFTEAAPPETISALQNLQIHANRATSSLLLYRGEGFQKAHLLRLEDYIRALNARSEMPAPQSVFLVCNYFLEHFCASLCCGGGARPEFVTKTNRKTWTCATT